MRKRSVQESRGENNNACNAGCADTDPRGAGAYMLYGAWQCAKMGEGFLDKIVIALIVLVPPVAMLIFAAIWG